MKYWGRTPAILSDDQISWNEILNKPSSFPPASPGIFTGNTAITAKSQSPGLKFEEIDETLDSTWYLVADVRHLWLQTRTNNFVYIDYAFKVEHSTKNFFFNGKVGINNIPTSNAGLLDGQLYKDANGFVKIV